jgi:hypothetical protein
VQPRPFGTKRAVSSIAALDVYVGVDPNPPLRAGSSLNKSANIGQKRTLACNERSIARQGGSKLVSDYSSWLFVTCLWLYVGARFQDTLEESLAATRLRSRP